MPIKVTITDDHPIVANGIKNILNELPQFEILDIYTSGNALLKNIGEHLPDVLMLDFNLPDTNAVEITKILKKKFPALKILIFTSIDIIVHVKKVLQAGADGFLLKESDDLTIIEAIETIHKGEQFLSPAIKNSLIDDLLKPQKKTVLTRREKEILQLIVSEYTNHEIAEKLFISPHTVDNHRINLLQKLQVKNTAGLVKVAIERGLVD
ncbi:response regulator [Polluticaenibacter yanchengensis]|uniref:Response regulator transcription factor n=1 Tax=Polluticaenibacter yanchengensis TaxID=3014562 RepID=A0ABT4UER1_9BACT|nr:response regulator transcription factor [Chitinophagaceae bacterium LY-5]